MDNRPLLVQRYPGDKWRWMVGSAYGRWYCELYRVPTSGPQDYAVYADKVSASSKKNANEICMALNESLRMGGMLGSIEEE